MVHYTALHYSKQVIKFFFYLKINKIQCFVGIGVEILSQSPRYQSSITLCGVMLVLRELLLFIYCHFLRPLREESEGGFLPGSRLVCPCPEDGGELRIGGSSGRWCSSEGVE